MSKYKKQFSFLVTIVFLLQLILTPGYTLASESVPTPTNLYALKNAPSDIVLKWDKIRTAQGYKVYELSGENKTLIKEVSSNYTGLTNLSEGQHVFAVSAVIGFSESSLSNSVEVDIVYPEMQSPKLSHNIYNGNDIRLTWESVPYGKSYNIYKVINGEKQLLKTTTNLNYTFSNQPEGTYTYAVSVVHPLYGESLESAPLTIELKHPTMQSPLSFKYTLYNGNDIQLSWEKTDYANSYKIYQLNGTSTELVGTTNFLTHFLRKLPEDNYSYFITSYSDRFGESKMSSALEINLTHPKMQPPTNLESAIVNGNDLFLKWDESEFATSYNIFQVIDGKKQLLTNTKSKTYYLSNLPEGKYSYEITSVSDRFGESEVATVITVGIIHPKIAEPEAILKLIDLDKAQISWKEVAFVKNYRLYKLVDGQPVLSKTVTGTSLNVVDLSEGIHEYVVTAYSDRFGESDYSNKVIADIGPPLKAPTSSEAIFKGDTATLSWDEVTRAASYNVYEVVNGELKLVENTKENSVTIENLTEGSNEYRIVPVNAAGEESENYSTITVETAPSDVTPPVTVSELVETCTNQDVAGKLTATDDESGVAKTFYSINGAEYVEGTSFTISEEGEHEVTFYSVDNAGNTETATTVKVHVDKTAPVTTSDAVEGWLNQDAEILLTATDNGCGVDKTYYSIDNYEFVEGSTVLVEEGIHQVSFYSVDKAGNKEETQTIEVKVDKTPPVTTSNEPDDWFKEDVTVQLTATDNLSGVDKTYYSINGSEYAEGTSFTVSEEGVTNVSFYSVDKAGNIEEAKTTEVKIDKVTPETTSNVTDDWSKEDFEVELTAKDNLSGVAKTYYSINGSEYLEGTSFTVSEEGTHNVSFYSEDNAGNIEEVKTVEVKIDKTAPIVIWDLADEYVLGAKLPGYTAHDVVSGIASEVLTVNGQEVSTINLDRPGTYKVVLTVTDNAGWTTTVEKTYVVYIPATVEISPGVIQENTGKFTVRVTLPKGFDSKDFDLSTATLDGVHANTGTNGLINQSKSGQFKFDRDDFTWTSGNRTMEFRAMVNGYLVVGSDTVQVKTKKK